MGLRPGRDPLRLPLQEADGGPGRAVRPRPARQLRALGVNGTASPFDNAREPLAQFFKPVGHPNSDGFAVIVNHFKSKGDSDPVATSDNANSPLVGAFNGDRTRQAKELLKFANAFADRWNTTKVFLVGDFNAYTGEDPVQAILNDPDNVDDLGFGLLESDDPDDPTYVFTATAVNGANVGFGAAGSLDHVFASADARDAITGTDVWEINSNEPGVYNYSRFDNNATNFWDAAVPFGGSDHNPEIIGINVAAGPRASGTSRSSATTTSTAACSAAAPTAAPPSSPAR